MKFAHHLLATAAITLPLAHQEHIGIYDNVLFNYSDHFNLIALFTGILLLGSVLVIMLVDYVSSLKSKKTSLENALLESSKILEKATDERQNLVGNLPFGFFTLDGNFNIVSCNQYFRTKFSSGAELKEKSIFEICPVLHSTDFSRRLKIVLESKIATSFEDQLESYGKTFKFSMFPNEGGIAVIYQDITNELEIRRQQVQSLQEIEDLNRAIDQSSIVAHTDALGTIIHVNDKFCEISKYSKKELIGQNHRILNSGFHPPEFFRNLWGAISTGKIWTGEIRNRAKDGSYYWVLTTIVPFLDDEGRPQKYVSIRTDITALKTAEEEKQKLLHENTMSALAAARLKSTFLANMSHEIRTPINGVIGMTSLLENTKLTAVQMDYLQTIKSSSESLLTIINDILDFSKIEANKLQLEIIPFDLNETIKETIRTCHVLAKNKGLKVSSRIALDNHNYFKGDPGRIRQILTNLLNNAIKFTASGSVTVNVDGRHMEGKIFELYFEVIDTGIGIPKDSLRNLFKVFSQLDSSTTRKYGGTGLGLSICKQLVELMGGKIYVQSEENKGSRFYFTIKLESIEEVPKPIIKRQTLKLDHKNKSYRILVVEDNQINQKVALCMLKSMGYQAVAVGNGLEALESLSQVPYDLVLMDCQMPVLDGYETTKRIRGNKSLPFHQIPIVAMTANAIIGEREKCISCGMSDYISKPVDSNNLEKVIKKWLANSELEAGTVDYSAWDTLRQMPSQNHENLLAEIINMFEKEVTSKPATMKVLAKKRDLTQLKKDAHTFKTSCANLGFRKLQNLCLQIESLDSQDWRVAEELIEGVSSECELALKIMAEDRKVSRLNAS